MLVEDIMCPECGGNATEGLHEGGCQSVVVMDNFCNFIESVQQYPNASLDKVKTVIYAEQMDRQIRDKRRGKEYND